MDASQGRLEEGSRQVRGCVALLADAVAPRDLSHHRVAQARQVDGGAPPPADVLSAVIEDHLQRAEGDDEELVVEHALAQHPLARIVHLKVEVLRELHHVALRERVAHPRRRPEVVLPRGLREDLREGGGVSAGCQRGVTLEGGLPVLCLLHSDLE